MPNIARPIHGGLYSTQLARLKSVIITHTYTDYTDTLLSAKFACLNIEQTFLFDHVPTERKTSHKKVSYHTSSTIVVYALIHIHDFLRRRRRV